MKILTWLLFALIALGARASLIDDTEDSECIEWGYEPVVEFHGPTFEESQIGKLNALKAAQASRWPEEYHAPLFKESQIELLDATTTQRPALEEFHGPKFDEGRIEVLEKASPLPNMPDVYFAPLFDAGQIDLIESHTTATEPPALEEFHGPKFEDGQVEAIEVHTTTTQQPVLEEFYGPKFDEGQVEPVEHLEASAQEPILEEFYGPKFDEGQAELVGMHASTVQPRSSGDYYVPLFEKEHAKPKGFYQAKFNGVYSPKFASSKYYPREKVYDGFVGDRPAKTIVEPAAVPVYASKVYDQFVAEPEKPKVERPKKEHSSYEQKHYKKPVKQYYSKKQGYSVDDDFMNRRPAKTIVESADTYDKTAEVHDYFYSKPMTSKGVKPKIVKANVVNQKPVDYPKKEQSTFERVFAAPLYESGPVTNYFLDLVGAKAPVHDNFVTGISEKSVVEPIDSMPAHKAEVSDEFTFSNDGKSIYRLKRSANVSSSSSENSLWKLVCIKRRPKLKPKILTAGDFLDAQTELNERITRCVGRYEGENVAAGLCRKHYLRCTAPSISVFMCSRQNEVFSEVAKQCVPKEGLSECDIKRTLRSRMISFSPDKNLNETQAPVVEQQDVFKGDAADFCLNRPDGFYADSANCSRILQCFDKELFEYPPCTKDLGFDVRRGVCDYAQKVPGCTNN